MEIKGVIDLSLCDWDGKVSSVFFLPECNFRCPFCCCKNGLVDYIAMDVKAPLTVAEYSRAIGVNAGKVLGEVEETIRSLLGSKTDYELRTTVVPTLHEEKDIEEICHSIEGCRKYVLQRFDVSGMKETLDPNFSKLKPFTDEEMEMFLAEAQRLLPNVKLR